MAQVLRVRCLRSSASAHPRAVWHFLLQAHPELGNQVPMGAHVLWLHNMRLLAAADFSISTATTTAAAAFTTNAFTATSHAASAALTARAMPCVSSSAPLHHALRAQSAPQARTTTVLPRARLAGPAWWWRA